MDSLQALHTLQETDMDTYTKYMAEEGRETSSQMKESSKLSVFLPNLTTMYTCGTPVHVICILEF